MITIPHPDGSIVVDLLTPNDWVAMSEQRWAAVRRQLVADLEESGASADARLGALRAHSSTKGSVMDALLHISTITGATETITLALKRIGRESAAGDCMKAMGMDKTVRTAMLLVGYNSEDSDANPTVGGSKTTF